MQEVLKALSPENPSLRLIIAVEVIVNSNKDSDFLYRQQSYYHKIIHPIQ